jgi:hypothetical protein
MEFGLFTRTSSLGGIKKVEPDSFTFQEGHEISNNFSRRARRDHRVITPQQKPDQILALYFNKNTGFLCGLCVLERSGRVKKVFVSRRDTEGAELKLNK